MIQSTCRWNNWTKFRKWITRWKLAHFRDATDTSRSRSRRIQVIIFIFVKKVDLPHFLCDLLSPLVPNHYSCKDSFSFVSQIKNVNLSRKFLVSYDVTGLFTNIPLQETIDIAINLIFNHNPNINSTKKELKKNFSFLLHHRLILFLTKIL